MKRIFALLMAIALLAVAAPRAAADPVVKKKVAVYMTESDVDDSYKKVIGSKMVAKITQSGTYSAVERTADFLRALRSEQDFQTSGEVKDSQIAMIGQKLGVKFVAVVDVSEVFEEIYISARLINVESGEIIATSEEYSAAASMAQLVALAEKVAAGLTGQATSAMGLSSTGSTMNGGAVETFTVNGVTFEMVRVEGGTFKMGSNDWTDSKPVHSETVGTFYIGRTEVTQQLWMAVMGSNPSEFRGENLPVENVSWYDCQEFVERLSRLTGRIFRLPTEAEWEYAARGGNRSRGYEYSGSDDIYRVGWYSENSGNTTHSVGQKLDNELGIFDMSGNVWEWCSDNYSDNYSSPRNSSDRVRRGGCWTGSSRGCRSASRVGDAPSSRDNFNGLRLAL